MKTLATFFVTLLLLAGSTWAQSQTVGDGGATGTDSYRVTKTTSTGQIADEVVVWANGGSIMGYELKLSELQKPADMSLSAAYEAMGREAVRQGMSRGYTPFGATATVWTSDHCYVMQFSTGNGVTLTSVSTSCGSIQ